MSKDYKTFTLAALASIGFLLAATVDANAHAHLVSAAPADKAVVASPSMIEAHFSEGLEPKFSSFDVIAPNGSKVALAQVTVDPKEKKNLSAAPQSPLPPGAYKVSWHVVAGDGHKSEGVYSFTVK